MVVEHLVKSTAVIDWIKEGPGLTPGETCFKKDESHHSASLSDRRVSPTKFPDPLTKLQINFCKLDIS